MKNIYRGVPLNLVGLVELFPASEGSINQYYGRIGSGKTYAATADLLKALESGAIVYANWAVNWQGYDERSSKWNLFLGLLRLKTEFYYFPKENFHYLPIDDEFFDIFPFLTDCEVFLDEGHLAFDSYEMAKMTMKKRASVLHTRHFNRVINIISQRPTAIHVTLRANVNRFFKTECVFKAGSFLVFRKTELQDLTSTGEVVDEESEPVSVEYYFGRKRVFQSYDSKYLRGDLVPSQKNFVQAFYLSFQDALKSFFS